MLSIPQTQEDYEQTALVTNLTPKQPHQNIAYERFTRVGPMALLPLRDERLALVLTLPASKLELYQAKSDNEFMAPAGRPAFRLDAPRRNNKNDRDSNIFRPCEFFYVRRAGW